MICSVNLKNIKCYTVEGTCHMYISEIRSFTLYKFSIFPGCFVWHIRLKAWHFIDTFCFCLYINLRFLFLRCACRYEKKELMFVCLRENRSMTTKILNHIQNVDQQIRNTTTICQSFIWLQFWKWHWLYLNSVTK